MVWQSFDLPQVVHVHSQRGSYRLFRKRFQNLNTIPDFLIAVWVQVGPAAILHQSDQALLAHELIEFLTLGPNFEEVSHSLELCFIKNAQLKSLLDYWAPGECGFGGQVDNHEGSVVAEPLMNVLQEFQRVWDQMQNKFHDNQVDWFLAGLAHVILTKGLNDPALERVGVHNNKFTFFAHFYSFFH